MIIPGNPQTHIEGPRGVPSDVGGSPNTPSRDTDPGGHRGEEVESRDVEVVQDYGSVFNSAGYDGTHPRSDGSERDVEMNMQCRHTGPLSHRGEQVELGGNQGNQERQNCGNGNDTGSR